MKLLDLPGPPNPRRVRIFLAEKELRIPVELVDVAAGANRTRDFLENKNPFGKLPVLELDDGTVISESVAICRYLEAVQPEPALMGIDPHDAAIIEMWNRRMELELFLDVAEYFHHSAAFFGDRYVQSPEVAKDARRRAGETLGWLDGVLARTPFVAGERFTIADITALVAIDLGVPSVFEIGPEQKNLARWHTSVSSRPSASA